jgi:uncharacterized protein (DUF488 family)
VRSIPYSRYNPQYNRENLQKEIIRNNMGYIYMGEKIGGKPQNLSLDRENTDFNFIFELIKKNSEFQAGIYELMGMLENNKLLSIMCAEENPLNCHRFHLICNYIIKNYPQTEILHIRGNGRIEKNSEIITVINAESNKKKLQSQKNQLSLFGQI